MITFKVVPDEGEPYEVKATSRDMVRWEKVGKGRSTASLLQSMAMADLSEIAYYASRRLKLTTAESLAAFEQEVDFEFDLDPVDPTRKAV